MDPSFRALDAAESSLPRFVPPIVLGRPDAPEWVRVSDLIDERTGRLRLALEAMAAERGYPERRSIGGGFALITTGALAGLAWRALNGLPLPAMAPEHAWWNLLPSANVEAVALDRAPDIVQPSEFGQVLHQLLDGLHAATHRETGFPIRAQWSLVASAIGQWAVEWMPDDHPTAVSQIEELFANDDMLRVTKPRVTWLEIGVPPKAFTTRRVCCFNYLGHGGEYCSSQCPTVPAEERVANAMRRYSGI